MRSVNDHSPSSDPTIALLAGFLGFDRLIAWHMFKGVKAHLQSRGWQVIQPLSHPTASIEQRCQDIADQITSQCSNGTQLHLIGHSMGGLDARYIASPGGLNWGDRVLSVTTLGTPHYGSPAPDHVSRTLCKAVSFASRVVWRFIPPSLERDFVRKLSEQGWEALSQLTPRHLCDTFNRVIVDDPRVRYFSYAAVMREEGGGVALIMRRIQGRLLNVPGTSHDGLVELESTRWGEFIGVCPTDHGGLIGVHPLPWRTPDFDYLRLFDEIAERLKAIPSTAKESSPAP